MGSDGILGKLKNILSSENEEIHIEPEDAAEKFREKRSAELEKARNRAEELQEKSRDLLDRLEEDLSEVNSYEDAADLDVVEDVAENFYSSRKRLIEDLELSEDIEEHYRELDDFLEEFNDVSQKEGAVMKRVQRSSGELSSTLQGLIDHRDSIGDFLDDGYRPVKQLEEVEKTQDDIESLEEELDKLEEKFDSVDTNDMDDRIEKLEEDIAEFHESEEWQEKEDLENELELLEEKRSEKEKELKRKVSKLDRGLKKLIYQIENEEQDFEGDFVKLKALFNGNLQKLDSPFPELEQASDILEEEDILDERQMEKFNDAVESLENFESDIEEIEEFEENIQKVEDKLDDIELEDKRRKLEKERKSVQDRLEEKQQKMEDLRDRIEEKEWEIENRKKELEKMLNDYLKPEVQFGEREEGSETEESE